MKRKHLFILSGQSNMVGMNPADSFTPAVSAKLGQDNAVVIKHARGGAPIRRWYGNWESAEGIAPETAGDLYEQLMKRVRAAVDGLQIRSVSLVWMQGEKDAREGHGEVYESSLHGLVRQLKSDLGRTDVNVVVGRLSDFDMENESFPDWTAVRQAQVNFVSRSPRAVWVNTDDLNDVMTEGDFFPRNDLHYSASGYLVLGKRLAAGALGLISGS